MKRRTLSLLTVALMIFGNLTLPVFSVANAQNTPAPQPVDNTEAVDITADCAGTAEPELPKDPGNVFPPEFNVFPPDGYPPLLPALVPYVPMPLGHIDWKIDSFSQLLDVMGFAGSQGSSIPVLHADSSHFGGSEGDLLSITTSSQNFATPPNSVSYAWWNVRNIAGKETLISLNGVVAGGREFRTLPKAGSTRCGIPTRNPKDENDTDNNGDGMGDRWEIQFFGTTAVNPKGDDDQDGVIVTPFINREDGKTLSIVPNAQSWNGKSFVTGDGSYTNLEEYVWGTNPLDPDSDDDGYLDESDVAGIGQATLSYIPSDYAGTSFKIEVDVLGDSTFRGPGDNPLAQMVGLRIPYNVNNKENFTLRVNTDNPSPDLETPFHVQASVFGTKSPVNLLEFSWSVTNNKNAYTLNLPSSPCIFQGFGQVLECTFNNGLASAGDTIVFTVNVHNPATGEKASETLTVPLGGSILITSDPVLVPQYPVDLTGKVPPRPAGDSISGERWVALTANIIGEDSTSFKYFWAVDQMAQLETCATTLLPKDIVGHPLGLVPCGVGTPILYYHATGLNTHVYSVFVKITQGSEGHPYGTGIMPLYTDTTPAAIPNAVAAVSQLLVPEKTNVAPGAVVSVSAQSLEGSNEHTYDYDWTVDSEPVISATNAKSLNFTAQRNKKTYTVALLVTEKDHGVPVSRKQESVLITVENQPAFEVWKNEKLAALSPIVAPLMRTVAGNSSLLLLLTGGILIVGTLVFGGKTKSL